MMANAKRLGIGILAGLLCAASGVSFAGTVTLKEEAYVKGPRVLLGDVAEIEGEDAEYLRVIEITPAALPGGAKRVDAALVRARLKGAGVSDSEVDVIGVRPVLARTLHLEVSRGMLAEDLRNFIRREMPWDIDETIIEVSPPSGDYVVRDGMVDIMWRPNPQYAYIGHGTFRGEILVDGESAKTFFAKANVKTYQEVVVASAAISRGDKLGPRNIRLEKRELSTIKGQAFIGVEGIQGYVSKSTIQAGQIVSARKIAPPVIVKRNQIIVVETQIGALTIRSRGRALSDGVAGEFLACASVGSKEEFGGVLRKDGVLVVE